jgi:hypothetical protein
MEQAAPHGPDPRLPLGAQRDAHHHGKASDSADAQRRPDARAYFITSGNARMPPQGVMAEGTK